MDEKIAQLAERHDTLERQLQQSDVTRDPERLKALAKEYNEVSRALQLSKKLQEVTTAMAETEKTLAEETDDELRQLGKEELATLKRQQQEFRDELAHVLRPADPREGKKLLVEIRAGAGGDEAALFAAELFRLYSRFAERHGLTVAVLSTSRTGIGGLKEAILEVRGPGAYQWFRFESGVHRVQRVPETEKGGRIHTSTATVAVLPEPEAVDVQIGPEDVKIEATTSSGHGGQSVNTTYSAIRMTHLPTGITVSCQDERSQKQNKEKAFQILRARLFAFETEKKQRAESAARKSQVGTGDRSEKIRTYNVPQDRVTDHRIKQNFPSIQNILDGGLDSLVHALTQADERS